MAVSDAVQSASVHAFHAGMEISALMVALGGLLGLAGIRNQRPAVRCEDCAGGQLAGQPVAATRRETLKLAPQSAVGQGPRR